MRIFNLVLVIFATNFSVAICQTESFNEQTFFKNLKNSYYSLESTQTQNFTVLLTNSTIEEFAYKQWKNSEIFPLQIIWNSPNRIFISEKGRPALSDSLNTVFSEHVSYLKIKAQNLLVNLQKFYFNGIYNSISENYEIENSTDLVSIQFTKTVKEDSINYLYHFGKNGLCLKILEKSNNGQLIIETIPVFKIIKTKWLIVSWQVKIINNGIIQAGYIVELKNTLLGNIWVPGEIMISVQQVNHIGKTFTDILKFRNYLFNQSLKIID